MSQNTSRQWYLQTEDGQNSGPFSDTDLQNMFQAGNIKPDTLAWCQELEGWQPVKDFPNTLKLYEKPEVVPTLGHHYVPAPPTVEQRRLRQEPQFQPKKSKTTSPSDEIASDEDLYAALWRRSVAYCIDAFVLTMVVVIASATVLSIIGRSIFEMKMAHNWVFINVLSAAYFAWFHAKYCATPGKFLMEIKLVSTENEPISFMNGMLHAIVFGVLSNVFLPHLLIIPFMERKQGLHDLLCGTVVLNHKMVPPQ